MTTLVYDTLTRTIYHPYQGKIQKLLDEKSPILRQKAEPFVFGVDGDPAVLAWDLIATMKQHKAHGLAAPQIGVSKRVFIADVNGNYTPVFNPEIIWQSDELNKDKESCLSFGFLCLEIYRPNKIEVKFQNEQGSEFTMVLENFHARVFLHEYDHLEGKLFDEYVKPLALSMAKKKRDKITKQIESKKRR